MPEGKQVYLVCCEPSAKNAHVTVARRVGSAYCRMDMARWTRMIEQTQAVETAPLP